MTRIYVIHMDVNRTVLGMWMCSTRGVISKGCDSLNVASVGGSVVGTTTSRSSSNVGGILLAPSNHALVRSGGGLIAVIDSDSHWLTRSSRHFEWLWDQYAGCGKKKNTILTLFPPATLARLYTHKSRYPRTYPTLWIVIYYPSWVTIMHNLHSLVQALFYHSLCIHYLCGRVCVCVFRVYSCRPRDTWRKSSKKFSTISRAVSIPSFSPVTIAYTIIPHFADATYIFPGGLCRLLGLYGPRFSPCISDRFI